MTAKEKTKFHVHQFVEEALRRERYGQETGLLYRWGKTHWCLLSETQAERDVYRWLVDNHRTSATPEMARRARKAMLLHSPPLPQATTDVVLPCLNGYVHFDGSDVHLRDPDPALGIRYLIDCAYEPVATKPRKFLDFLEMVLPDASVRARVQEYIGYTLTSDTRYQRAQFWLGKGANGKGVLQQITSALHRKPESVHLDALEGFKLSGLLGASLVCCDEVPRGRINEQLLKSLIAGEPVQIDQKFRDPVSARVLGKWIVLGNHLPRITDHSEGFWRRWDIIPFDVVVPASHREPGLANKIIDTELAGVLNWALEGLCRLQRRGGFELELPMPMAELLQRARQETDPLRTWFEESVVVAQTATTDKATVYDGYRAWCVRNGVQSLSSPHFWSRLRDMTPLVETRPRVSGTQVRRCNLELRFE